MHGQSIFAGTKTWKRRSPDLAPTPQAKWNRANAEKLRAHALVRQALRDGTLKRGICAVCGSFRVEAHHADYAMPLDVRWLSRKCHQRVHVLLKAGKSTEEAIAILKSAISREAAA